MNIEIRNAVIEDCERICSIGSIWVNLLFFLDLQIKINVKSSFL